MTVPPAAQLDRPRERRDRLVVTAEAGEGHAEPPVPEEVLGAQLDRAPRDEQPLLVLPRHVVEKGLQGESHGGEGVRLPGARERFRGRTELALERQDEGAPLVQVRQPQSGRAVEPDARLRPRPVEVEGDPGAGQVRLGEGGVALERLLRALAGHAPGAARRHHSAEPEQDVDGGQARARLRPRRLA